MNIKDRLWEFLFDARNFVRLWCVFVGFWVLALVGIVIVAAHFIGKAW